MPQVKKSIYLSKTTLDRVERIAGITGVKPYQWMRRVAEYAIRDEVTRVENVMRAAVADNSIDTP